MVFSYDTSIANSDTYWEKIRKVAEKEGWKEIKADNFKRFDRIRKWKEDYYIGEEIRIAYLREKVILAYAEGDTKQKITSFSEIKESKWADKNIWPMFEKEITKH